MADTNGSLTGNQPSSLPASLPTRQRSHSKTHRDTDADILAALDLRAEFVALGVTITDETPNSNGWCDCFAVGRQENSPSAAVNLGNGKYRGRYVDKGAVGGLQGGQGSHESSLSFWDFAARFGNFLDWRAARRHYAEKTGIRVKKDPAEDLDWQPWNPLLVKLWCRHKPGITAEAVEAAGGRIARYTYSGHRQFVVIALPVFGPALTTADPVGWVLWNITGGDLPVYQGKGQPPAMRKMKTTAGSEAGLMFRRSLELLQKHAERSLEASPFDTLDATGDPNSAPPPLTLWKCEGPGDALALFSSIQPALRETHLPLCNSGGAGEIPQPDIISHFAGHQVNVVGDADEAGESGAKKWTEAAAAVAVVEDGSHGAKKITLPYPILLKHGKDLRDWLSEGNAFGDLLSIAESTEPTKPPEKSEDSPSSDARLPITNADTVSTADGEVALPLPMQTVISRIFERTDGWPRRIDNALFVQEQSSEQSSNGEAADQHTGPSPIYWLENAPAVFGWLQSRAGIIDWKRSAGCCSKEEAFHELRRQAHRYLAVETLPHEPLIPGHFYACQTHISNPPGTATGDAITELVDRFSPETPIDRQLIWAMFATVFWGGRGGSRPAFMITSDSGRGAGKTKITDMVSYIAGGHIELSQHEDAGVMRQRLLSPEGINKRVARLDNVKSLKFSWSDLESLITAPTISGKRMYVGESSRPNTLTWLITLNGAALSTDMSQRSVLIKIARPKRSGSWEADVLRFIDDHREQIISDLLETLRLPPQPLAIHTRWATWETEVLARMADPEEIQRVVAERSGQADVEAEEVAEIEDYFREQLEGLGYKPDHEKVHIPSQVAAVWYQRATNERRTVTGVSRLISQFCREGRTQNLCLERTVSRGRGFLWIGQSVGQIDSFLKVHQDIELRIREKELLK